MKQYDLPLDENESSRERKIIDMIEPNSVILEFGCSYGRLANYLLKNKSCTTYGIEIDPEAFEQAKSVLKDGMCTDIDLMLWREKFQGLKFDYILFADVLEHLKFPEEVLKEAKFFLKETGSLIFSIPNIAHADIVNKLIANKFDYTDVGILDRTHLHFWGSENLNSLCEKTGFTLIELDGTYQEACLTEQGSGAMAEVNRIINSKRHGSVYQFICKAVKSSYAIEKGLQFINKIKESERVLQRKTKLYYDYGQGFSELNSSVIFTDYFSDVEFSVSVDNVKFLRVDPCDGSYCILRDLKIMINGNKFEDYHTNGKEKNNYIFFDNVDPQIILPIEAGKSDKVIRIKYSLFVFYGFDYECVLDDLLKQNYNGDNVITSNLNSLEGHILELNTKNNLIENKIKECYEQIALFNDYMNLAEDTNKKLVSTIEKIELKNEDLKAKKNDLIIELDQVKNENSVLKHLNEHYLELSNEKDAIINELNEKLFNSEKISCEANEYSVKYRESLSKIIKDTNLAFAQLDSILNSTSWKLTAPMRSISRLLKKNKKNEFVVKAIPENYTVVDIIVPVCDESLEQLVDTLDSFLSQSACEKHMVLLITPMCASNVVEVIFKYSNENVEIDCLNCSDLDLKKIVCLYSSTDYVGIAYPGDTFDTCLVETINDYTKSETFDFMYTDSAYIDNNEITQTRYKPNFSIDTLRAMNYIDGMVFINKNTLLRVQESVDLAKPYDMILKLSEVSLKIKHLPRLLYFRNVNSFTTPEKDVDAINNHLLRCGLSGFANSTETDGVYKVNYALNDRPLISIIIPNKDHIKDLKPCISSIFNNSTYKNIEIIVVENNSNEEKTFEYYKSLNKKKNVKVVTFKGKFNYSKINNWAVKFASGKYYIFMNNDTEVISKNWIEEMLMLCQRNDVGAVGAKLYYPDKRIQHAGVILGVGGVAAHAFRLKNGSEKGYMNRAVSVSNVSAVTGACLMIKSQTFSSIGGFNEKLPVDFNDVDLCMKIRKLGLNIVYTPYAELYHNESVSRGAAKTEQQLIEFMHSVNRFKTDWFAELKNGDPYYNENFTLENADFICKSEFKDESGEKESVEDRNVDTELNELEMSISQKLNRYLDIDNYPRALAVINHKRRFDKVCEFKNGLSIVILNLNKPELIISLLKELVNAKLKFAEKGFDIDILVGDTGSTDKEVLATYKKLSEHVKVLYDMKYNFSCCNNEVFEKLVNRKYTLFLNNDVVFPDAYLSLKTMLEKFENENIGIVGSYLFYPDKKVQHIGIDFFKTGEASSLCFHPKHMQSIVRPQKGYYSYTPATTGACLLIKSDLFMEIDGFDENYLEECQDVALCLSARRLGYEIVTVYSDEVLHLENATRPKGSENWKDRRYFLRKWKSYIEVL